jgi:hypothetical protein
MQAEAIEFKQFDSLLDDTCEQRIVAAKAVLGKRAIILAHHYQRADVYKQDARKPGRRRSSKSDKSTGSGGKARTGKDVRSFIGSPTHKLAGNLSLYPTQ